MKTHTFPQSPQVFPQGLFVWKNRTEIPIGLHKLFYRVSTFFAFFFRQNNADCFFITRKKPLDSRYAPAGNVAPGFSNDLSCPYPPGIYTFPFIRNSCRVAPAGNVAPGPGVRNTATFRERKSTHCRGNFTGRKAYFTLRSNISPTRKGGFRWNHPHIWYPRGNLTTSVGKISEKTLIFLKKGIDFIENFAIIG